MQEDTRLRGEQRPVCSVSSRPYPILHVASRETAIDTLTSKRRAELRSLAHPLKPILHVGKEGVTVAAVRAVRDAFNTREILKIKVLESAPDSARDTAEALVKEIADAHVVQVIGRTVVLYRPSPEKPAAKASR